jgi:hypothetical protein
MLYGTSGFNDDIYDIRTTLVAHNTSFLYQCRQCFTHQDDGLHHPAHPQPGPGCREHHDGLRAPPFRVLVTPGKRGVPHGASHRGEDPDVQKQHPAHR